MSAARRSHLLELDPSDDAALADLLALRTAAAAVDTPWEPPLRLRDVAAGIRAHWDGEPARQWLLRDAGSGGGLIGRLIVRLPERRNRRRAMLNVLIHPEHRRSGHGRRLYEYGRAVAVESGRRLLSARTVDAAGPNAFAARLGFRASGANVHSRQHLASVDRERVAALREQAASIATAYRLLRIVGPVPADLLDAYAVMYAAIDDAPTGALAAEPDVVDGERVRRSERAQAAQGRTVYQLVAQRVSDGALAGHTAITYDPERPQWAGQHNTAVLSAHRGHRLGLLLKATMVEWILTELPGVRYLDTNNAESNHHMIRINNQLGYRILARYVWWTQDLPGQAG